MSLWHLGQPVSIQVDWAGFDLCANNVRPSGQQDHFVKFWNKKEISPSLSLTVRNDSGSDTASY